MTYTQISDIKAQVKTSWSHHRHKFQPGVMARVSARVIPREWVSTTGEIRQGRGHVSQRKQRRVGRVGQVRAVSCTSDGRVRGPSDTGFCERMYTRYYIQFQDGTIMGYDSHHLDQA